MIAAMPDKPYYVPKRRPNSGRRVQFWVSTAVEAALQAYATEHGCSVNQAAKRILEAAITAKG